MVHDFAVKLHIHPLNGKIFVEATVYVENLQQYASPLKVMTFRETIEMRLKSTQSVGFGRLECND